MSMVLIEKDKLKLALEALEDTCFNSAARVRTASKIIKESLAQPEQDCTRSHPHESMNKECELQTEIARLTNCLARANAQAEHFEREWYLRGDEIERLRRAEKYMSQEKSKLSGNFAQPHWGHVGQAFIDGAREARLNPDATEHHFNRSADGYTKRLFEELDPESEKLLRTNGYQTPPQPKEPEHSASHGEPVAIVHRNEYNEYRLEPHDNFDIRSIPFNVDVPLFQAPKRKTLTDEPAVWSLNVDDLAIYRDGKRFAELDEGNNNDSWREAMRAGSEIVRLLNAAPQPSKPLTDEQKDSERYQMLRSGRYFRVITNAGVVLTGNALDTLVDEAAHSIKGEA